MKPRLSGQISPGAVSAEPGKYVDVSTISPVSVTNTSQQAQLHKVDNFRRNTTTCKHSLQKQPMSVAQSGEIIGGRDMISIFDHADFLQQKRLHDAGNTVNG